METKLAGVLEAVIRLYALRRLEADLATLLGERILPVEAATDIPNLIRCADESGCHPLCTCILLCPGSGAATFCHFPIEDTQW